MNVRKYSLTKLNSPHDCWYKIALDEVKELFEDTNFTGEILHLYNNSQNGCESLIQSLEMLEETIELAKENNTSFVIHLQDAIFQEHLFTITTD